MTWHSKRGHFGQVSALGERCQVSITPKMRLLLIGAALRQSRLSDALEHVRLLPRGNDSTLPQTMIARLVSLAAREQRLPDAIQLLKELDVCLETQTLDDLLQEAARRQDTQMRQQLHQFAGRVEPAEQPSDEPSEDLTKQVTMIKACGQERNLQGAVRVFDRLKQKGIQMNALIYNCLIDACVQCRDTAAALEYFEQMKQLGFADVVSYNTVLKAHLALGRFAEAQALAAGDGWERPSGEQCHLQRVPQRLRSSQGSPQHVVNCRPDAGVRHRSERGHLLHHLEILDRALTPLRRAADDGTHGPNAGACGRGPVLL